LGEPILGAVGLPQSAFGVTANPAVISSFGFALEDVDKKDHAKKAEVTLGLSIIGSPCATLFITVLVLRLLTENLQYQRVIKERAVPGGPEAALNHISPSV
jgi:hypothetical protein